MLARCGHFSDVSFGAFLVLNSQRPIKALKEPKFFVHSAAMAKKI